MKKSWLIRRRLLPHVARCSYIVLNGLVADDRMDWAYHSLGVFYAEQSKLDEAEKMYQRALQGYEKAFGPDDIATLATVRELGDLPTARGEDGKAEGMLHRAL